MILEQANDKKDLTKTEKQIFKFIQDYPRIVINLSLSDLSRECFISQASIIRLCKKLGTKGFADFKIKLASELSTFALAAQPILADIPISPNDNCEEIMKVFYNLSFRALETTFNDLNAKDIENAAALLVRADIVRLYGRGESLIVAEDFHYKLLRMGINSNLETLNGFQEVTNGDTNKKTNTVALIISQYCNSRQLHYVIDELVNCRIPFILLTATENAWPYDKLAKVTLRIRCSESRQKMGSFASRTAMLYLLDCIYGQIFALDYKTNRNKLTAYSQRKSERKYYYKERNED
jgi:DNA-binding MurR/RpiR family transcriptional regulator